MTALTHQRAGLLCGLMTQQWVIQTHFDDPNRFSQLFLVIIFCSSTMIGALIPDLDMKSSQLSQLVPFLSKMITRRYKHRTLTHSLLSLLPYLLLIELSVFLNVSREIFILMVLGLLIGHLSHMILDLLTSQGIALLYPIKRKVHLAPFKTGGKAERVISRCLMASITCYFVYETYLILRLYIY